MASPQPTIHQWLSRTLLPPPTSISPYRMRRFHNSACRMAICATARQPSRIRCIKLLPSCLPRDHTRTIQRRRGKHRAPRHLNKHPTLASLAPRMGSRHMLPITIYNNPILATLAPHPSCKTSISILRPYLRECRLLRRLPSLLPHRALARKALLHSPTMAAESILPPMLASHTFKEIRTVTGLASSLRVLLLPQVALVPEWLAEDPRIIPIT